MADDIERPDWLLLTRYLGETAVAEERTAVERWLSGDPARQSELDGLRAVWAAGAQDSAPPEVNAAATTEVAWRALRRRVGTRTHPAVLGGIGGRARFAARPVWVAAAAAVVVAALVGMVGVRAQLFRLGASRAAGHEYVAARGERVSVTLADGTQFVLAPGSRLRVAPHYGAPHRDVELEGEAYFAVTHDVRHPFAVRAGGTTATDVGTRFDVRAYASDAAVRIAVAEGGVSIADRTRDTLRAGDLAVVSRAGTVTVRHGVDAEQYLGWRDGELTFRSVPLRLVLPDLARWYNLDLRLADHRLGDAVLTASFRNDSADAVLNAVAKSVDATVSRQGRTVTFTRQTVEAR